MLTSAAPLLTWHRTRENILAAKSDSVAYLALPTPDGACRIAVAFDLDTPPDDWTPDRFHASSLFAPDETLARERIVLIEGHRDDLEDDNRRDLTPGTPTPWGEALDTLYVAPGIVRHHTASHGGYQLDPALNALVHPTYRNDGGWYEDDVEWAKVAVTFPTLFPLDFDRADEILAKRQPDAYAQVNGLSLELANSDATVERTETQELAAMRRINLPEYAQAKHGYSIEWRARNHDRALLTKGDDRVRAVRDGDGTWSYNTNKAHDVGDIVDFELNRGARHATVARAIIRSVLQQIEREHGRLDTAADLERERDTGLER